VAWMCKALAPKLKHFVAEAAVNYLKR